MRLFILALVGVLGMELNAHQEPSRPHLYPRIEQSPSGEYTIPPQVMTYAELAQLLTTPARKVEVHPELRQKGVLIALKERSWDDLRSLLEYGLEIQFVKQETEDGLERWQIMRHPDAKKRDTLLFDRYVRLAHERLTTQLRQFDEWFGRPREALKQELEQMELKSLGDFLNEADPWKEARIPAQAQSDWARFLDGLWVQSLDGYVMLQWMRRNWTESLTRQLIRERMIIVQQPLAKGFPGIITEDDLRDFLKGVPESELMAYDWAIGVVSWSAELRMVFPYCDIVAPHAEGTQWMIFPLSLRVEPLSWEDLWQALGAEAERYLDALSERQKTLTQEPTRGKLLAVEHANALSQILQVWATTYEREVLMELAPERERVPIRSPITLAQLAEPNLSQWLGGEQGLPSSYFLAALSYLREPIVIDKTLQEVEDSVFKQVAPRWYYELHNTVLIARNPLAFLDRQYTYPLDALFTLERAPPQVGDDLDRFLEVVGTFAWSLIRQPDHAPTLAGYRESARLGASLEKLPILAFLASLPAQERQELLKRLRTNGKVRIPLQRAGVERLDAFTRFWRRTAHYSPDQSEPFGYRNAWHPRFTLLLRQATLVITFEPDTQVWDFKVEIVTGEKSLLRKLCFQLHSVSDNHHQEFFLKEKPVEGSGWIPPYFLSFPDND